MIKINLFLLAILYYNNSNYRKKACRTRELKRLTQQQERTIRAGINSFVISLDIFELEPKQATLKEKFNIEKDLLIPFLKEELFASYLSSALIEFMLEIANDLDFVELLKFVEGVKKNPKKFIHGEKEEKEEKKLDIFENVELDEVKKREKVIEFRSTFGGANSLKEQKVFPSFKGTATFGEIEKIAPVSGSKMDEEENPQLDKIEEENDGKLSQSHHMHKMGRAQYFFNKFIKPGYKVSKKIKEKRKIFKIQRPKTRQHKRKPKSTKVKKRPPTANCSSVSSGFSFPRSKRSLSLGPCIARKYIIRPKREKISLKKNPGSENLIDLQNYRQKSQFLKDTHVASKENSYSKLSKISGNGSNVKIVSETKELRMKKTPVRGRMLEESILVGMKSHGNRRRIKSQVSDIQDMSYDGIVEHGFSLKDWENDIVAKATPRARKTRERRGTLTFNN